MSAEVVGRITELVEQLEADPWLDSFNIETAFYLRRLLAGDVRTLDELRSAYAMTEGREYVKQVNSDSS